MAEWATITDADIYFSKRMGESLTVWPTLSDTIKQACLTTSYTRIYYSNRWNIPANPTPVQLEKLQIAQIETAWYCYIHIDDEDRRMGLQAQNVIEADIVGETYKRGEFTKVPFPDLVEGILEDFDTLTTFSATEIGRDENKSIDDATVVEEW